MKICCKSTFFYGRRLTGCACGSWVLGYARNKGVQLGREDLWDPVDMGMEEVTAAVLLQNWGRD